MDMSSVNNPVNGARAPLAAHSGGQASFDLDASRRLFDKIERTYDIRRGREYSFRRERGLFAKDCGLAGDYFRNAAADLSNGIIWNPKLETLAAIAQRLDILLSVLIAEVIGDRKYCIRMAACHYDEGEAEAAGRGNLVAFIEHCLEEGHSVYSLFNRREQLSRGFSCPLANNRRSRWALQLSTLLEGAQVLKENPVALILKSQLALKCTSVYACERSPVTCLKGELVSFCRIRNAFHRLSTYATVIPAQMALDGGRSQLKHLRGHGSPRKLK